MSNKALLERIRLAEQGIYEEPKQIQQPIDFKKLIAPIVGIAFAAGTGILALVFFIQPAIDKATENPDISEPAKGMISVLSIVFVAVIMLGAVAYMGANKGQPESEEAEDEQTLETH